ELLQHLGRHFGVHVDHGEGLPAGRHAGEVDPGDVDAGVAEHHAHRTDDLGNVLVPEDEEIAAGDRVQDEVVHPDDPRVVLAEEATHHRQRGTLPLQLHTDGGGV